MKFCFKFYFFFSYFAQVTDIPKVQLESWLGHVVRGFYGGDSKDVENSSNNVIIEENCHLLHCLTNFIVETSVAEEVFVSENYFCNFLLNFRTIFNVKNYYDSETVE